MVRRHRCVNCWRLFTPNYRNRTKGSARQRVCAGCGSVIGHRFADRRYRSGDGPPRRARESVRTSLVALDTEPALVSERPCHALTETDLTRQVHVHLTAIAALVDARAHCAGHGPDERLSVGLGVNRDQFNA